MKLKDYILGIAIIIIDQISKALLINKNIVLIPNVFKLTYTENTGGAFGIGNRLIVTIISTVLIVAIIALIVKEREKITNYIPVIFLLAGSLSNLLDRILRGYVIDFIDILEFPNFNIADICIVLGIFISVIMILIKLKKSKQNP